MNLCYISINFDFALNPLKMPYFQVKSGVPSRSYGVA